MTILCLDQCIFVPGYRKCTGSPGCENPVWLVSTTIPRGMFMFLTVDIISLSDASSLLTIPQCSLWNASESPFVICVNRPQFQPSSFFIDLLLSICFTPFFCLKINVLRFLPPYFKINNLLLESSQILELRISNVILLTNVGKTFCFMSNLKRIL